MRLLRDDIIISPRLDEPGCLMLDQPTGEEYEFGEVEHFLLERFRQPCDLDQLCGELNTRFGLTYSIDDLESFLNLLEEWGLLRNHGASPLPKPSLPDNGPNEPDALTGSFSIDLKQPNRWHLFNPERFFDGSNRLFPRMCWLIWLTPILVAFGVSTVLLKYDAFIADYAIASIRFGVLPRLILAVFTINLATQIVRGIVARHLGLSTPSLGIALLLGILPRFNVQIVHGGELEKGARLLLTAVSTLVRLWLFGTFVLLWAITRPSGTFLPTIALEFAFISAMGLLFVANPFWRGDGANFLSTWLEAPNLHQRSRRALMGFIFRQPAAIVRHSRHNILLGLFGLSSLALFCGFLSFVVYGIFHYLESRYLGAGVALFLVLGAYASLSLRRQSSASKTAQARKRGTKLALSARTRADTAASASRSEQINRSSTTNKARPWGVYLLFIAVLAILLLPYRYETGGDAEVFPSARATITLDTDGLLEEVNFKGGEYVKAGTVLARIADYKQSSDLRILEADIESKKYEIQQYRTTPSNEDIRLAEEKIRTARLQAKYSEEKLARQEALALQGFISPQALSDARSASINDQQALAEAVASLESLKAKVNPYQIQSLIAELVKLQHEADYIREKLRRTQLVSPIDGQIVTTDLQYLRNSFLEAGNKFADIEDKRTVILHISVPEADLKEISIGAPITLKLFAYSDREFVGKVEEIPLLASSASSTTASYRIVQVRGRLNNPDGLLLTGLTGYAKITGTETTVLLAFTSALVRFVTIEAWSWLP